jgi:hypothetical protein
MTPDLYEALTTRDYWITVLATLVLIAFTVGLHFEGLNWMSRSIPRWQVPHRLRVLLLVYCLVLLHTLEIWAFGLALFLLVQVPGLGRIGGADPLQLLDAVYLSAITYSTVGYGDLVPHGPLRLALASEALTGLLMITWSASFTFLEMERLWRPRRGERE